TIEKASVKILVVLVPEIAIGSREVCIGALKQLQRKTAVISDTIVLVIPAQEIEFSGYADFHCRGRRYYPGIGATTRRSSRRGSPEGEEGGRTAANRRR